MSTQDAVRGPAMTENKRPWTPGPWSIPHFATGGRCGCGYVFGNDGRCGAIATVGYSDHPDWQKYGDDPTPSEAIANARLMAAAPELYEALADILDCIDSDGVLRLPGNGSTLQTARTALRAANPDAFDAESEGK